MGALAPAPLYVPAGSTISAAIEVAPVPVYKSPPPPASARWLRARCMCRPDRSSARSILPAA